MRVRHPEYSCANSPSGSGEARSGMDRRSFLQLLAADAALVGTAHAANPAYQVGVGSSSDPYTATQRAISASGQFPAAAIAGNPVVIKPNLVSPQPASSGITTDPQVVRAIVDMALSAGASQVSIVEASPLGRGPYWKPCGYDVVFNNYDPRVHLVDLRTGTYAQVAVTNGYAYQSLWLPSLVMQPNTVFISAGKMKTHVDAVATLSMKNLVGLAQQQPYQVASLLPRQDLHYRGIDLAVVDLNLARPIHYAVVDGVWAMQGNGPIQGTPVAMNMAVAGLNPLAVDRVALSAMQVPQNAVPHLSYATFKGLGPTDVSKVKIVGDSYSTYAFAPATTGPIIWQPTASPASFSVAAGGLTTFSYKLLAPCQTRVEIIADNDTAPGIATVRSLQPWTSVAAPTQSFVWHGANNSNVPMAPGLYLARVSARFTPTSQPNSFAVAMVLVTG